jgi:hypothetical protein
MLEYVINVSLTQRFFVCFSRLGLMCSALYAFRHVIRCSTRQPGSA